MLMDSHLSVLYCSSSAPIEGASLANLKSQIETAAKAAVKTANEEILKEMKNVIGRVEQDSAFANAVATNLGFVFTSSKSLKYVEYFKIIKLQFIYFEFASPVHV